MNAKAIRKTGPLGNADALARQAHANAMQAARNEFAAVMRQLNQAPSDTTVEWEQNANTPQTAAAERQDTQNERGG